MSITLDVLSKYKNMYFVETGTYLGDTVNNALKIGFNNIYSIELSEDLYVQNIEKYQNNKNVSLFCGDSSKILFDVIKNINSKITFWLDAHYSGGNTVKGKKNCPIINELNLIKKHKLKNHIILIDDIRLFGKNYLLHEDLVSLSEEKKNTCLFIDIEEDYIKEKIMQINKKYQFRYENGNKNNDILVAYCEV